MQCWWGNLICSGTLAVTDIGESFHISEDEGFCSRISLL